MPPLLASKYRIASKLVFSKMHAALGGRLRFAVSGGAPLSRVHCGSRPRDANHDAPVYRCDWGTLDRDAAHVSDRTLIPRTSSNVSSEL